MLSPNYGRMFEMVSNVASLLLFGLMASGGQAASPSDQRTDLLLNQPSQPPRIGRQGVPVAPKPIQKPRQKPRALLEDDDEVEGRYSRLEAGCGLVAKSYATPFFQVRFRSRAAESSPAAAPLVYALCRLLI